MNRTKIKKFIIDEPAAKQCFYKSTRPLFNICYISDKLENKVKFCGTFSSCRAYSTDIIRTIVVGKRHPDDGHSYHMDKNEPLIKLNDAILGVGYNTDIEHILNLLTVINHYNTIGNLPKLKLIGFSEATNLNLWFIKMPMRHKEKSFLTSMISLLIRILTSLSNETLERLKSVDDIETYLHEHRENKDNSFSFSDRTSLYHTNNYLKLRIIMKNNKKLFYGLGNKTLFPFSVGYTFHDKSGINSLCTAITLNKVLNTRSKRMLKVKKVENEETKVKEEKVYTTKT